MPSTFDTYGPFDSGPGANAMEELWRKVARNNRPDGVLATNTLPNTTDEMEVYANSSGMQVKVRVGEVIIRGHWGKIASEKTVPIPNSHASLPRIDLVVCRADFLADKIELDVLTGVPAASPTAPTATVNTAKRELPLAEVRVDAGVSTIAANKVTDRRERQGYGLFKTWTPPLYYEGPANSWQKNNVGMGTGATRVGKWFQSGKVVQITYEFRWGTGPYGGGTGRIWTELPPGLTAADEFGPGGIDHRVPAHLFTTSTGNMDFQGTALISPGTNRVNPFFTHHAVDARIGWYVIARNGSDPYEQWPFISGGFPEGGVLTISGLLEVR